MATPLISIVMPAYNGAAHIRESIDSVLKQSFGDFELIVVNDGSTDDTPAIVASYADPRVRLVTQTNAGTAAARNRGLSESGSPLVALLDADDLMHPKKLEKQVAYLNAHPDIGVVGCDVQIFGSRNIAINFPGSPDAIFAAMLFESVVVNSATLMRRSCLPAGQSIYRSQFIIAEDYDFWLRLLENGVRFANLNEPLLNYRAHGEQKSSRYDAHHAEVKQIYTHWLSRLGIEASPAELQMHLDIAGFQWRPEKKFVSDMEAWLLKISRANARVGFLPQRELTDYLRSRWWSACVASKGLGRWLAFKMVSSPLYPWRRRVSRSFWKLAATAFTGRS